MKDEGYNLLIPFLDESPSFCHGYECGKIMEQMVYGQIINTMVHAINKKQIEMMSEIKNYTTEFRDVGDGWLKLIAEPKTKEGNQAPK